MLLSGRPPHSRACSTTTRDQGQAEPPIAVAKASRMRRFVASTTVAGRSWYAQLTMCCASTSASIIHSPFFLSSTEHTGATLEPFAYPFPVSKKRLRHVKEKVPTADILHEQSWPRFVAGISHSYPSRSYRFSDENDLCN